MVETAEPDAGGGQPPGRRIAQERAEIVDRFANVLADRFGRSAEEVRDRGLGASNFSLTQSCRVQWRDGSNANFEHAFAVQDPERKRIGIFAEHCGYFDMAELGITIVSEIDGQTTAIYP